MNQGKSFLKRFFALVMALALLVSGSNLGAVLQVSAAGSSTYVNVGKLVADNYALTDAEKALLSSGYLAGETISYTAPTNEDGLVTVDTEKRTITAEEYKGWIPTIARIKVGTEVIESIALDGGKGTYTFDKNAFSVEVDYIYDVKVAVADQERLLNSVAWLKNGVANIDGLVSQSGVLPALEEKAMPLLVDLADNGYEAYGKTAQVKDYVKNSIYRLNDQMTANGGHMDLIVMQDAFGLNKVGYLLNNGLTMKAELEKTRNDIANIRDFLGDLKSLSDLLGEDAIAPEILDMIDLLYAMLVNWVNDADKAIAADWTAAEKGTALVSDTVDYAKLNALVAALGELTPMPAIKETLHVADTTLTVNLSMFYVGVDVVLKVVMENEIVVHSSMTDTLILAEGATADEILAEVAANGIEAAAKAEWELAGVYVAEHFEVTKTALPSSLNENIIYTITYSPKNYTVTYSYADTEVLPYGYQLTLPVHENAEQAYDYTVNGKPYAQGEVVTIIGNTEITRSSGKAYTSTDLYTVVSNNYGNDLAKEILQSGALKDNNVINVRKPDPADAASILQLLDGKLTAQNYNAAYAGLSWVPYSYNGNLFNGANEVSFSGKSAEVIYRLYLTNFSVEKVADILALAVTLKSEAETQKQTLDNFLANKDTMGQLDKTKLGALNGVIDVTDFTPGDGTDTDAANLEMRAYFKGLVSGIIANNLDSNNYLRIYNMLAEYEADGLRYYYQNYEDFIAEIESLAGYLHGMLEDEAKVEALRIMVTAANYPEYADKIADLETKLTNVLNSLSKPNAAIDVNSENLGKLLNALTKEEAVVVEDANTAYLISETLTALDESQVMVQLIIDTPNGSATVRSDEMDKGTVLTQAVIDDLQAKYTAKINELLGVNAKFYTIGIEGPALNSLVGETVNANINIYYTAAPTVYSAVIDGEADQTVTINDLEINLPKHPTAGWKYEYTVDGESNITASTYTFTIEQLERLFTVNGTYTITRVAINEAAEKVEATFADWLVKDSNGNITGLYAKVDGNKDGIMDFAMTIVNSGYTYIGLNGEPLLYLNEEDTLEICLQTLVNAILHDNAFGSETLINLGKNGKGEFVHASMQLGNAADDLHFENLDFTLYMNSVPSQMGTVSNGLETIKPYMTFNSNNGIMDVKIDLPEKVYEVYLAGMLVTGNVSKDDMDAINSEIAFQFFYDYIEFILNSEATTTTFSNTLEMLGKPHDLTGYEKYYQMVKKAMTSEGVQINPTEDGKFDMTVSGGSQKAINALIELLGVDVSAYETYLAMVKEYKYADAKMGASANAILVNTDSGFEAALVDLNASGVANKFDFTKDMPARCASIADKAAVILLDTIDGNLVFNGTTILDLNGQTVNGNIVANGTLIIVDSALDTDEGGYVSGSVSGNVTVIAGKYASDVSAFLKDGYKQVGGAVQNALYTIESDGNDVTFVINTDVLSDESVNGYIPNARALAVDIAVDLLLNYYTAGALTAEGNTIYNLHIDDLLALYASSNRVDELIQVVLDCVNLPELSAFANIVLEDLFDFGAIATALENNDVVATYAMTTAPWAINVSHVTDGDYITAGFGANNMARTVGKSFDVALKFVGSNKDRVIDELYELDEIVDASATVNLTQPVYDGASNFLSVEGTASASATLTLNEKDVYANILALILANGNSDVRADLVAAVNAGDREKMKDIIDEMTVADLFAAMKALNRNESFVDIAAKLGVTADVSKDTDLEKAAHLVFTALGKVLEELDITGMNSKFGALDKDDDGIYEFTAKASRDPSISRRGYTAYAEVSVDVALTVNLFGEPQCLWGDVDHDGDVDIADAEYAMMKALGAELAIDYCMKRGDVDCDGKITVFDAEYIMMYALGAPVVFPVVH